MRVLAVVIGIVLAAIGGVILYRTIFLEPSTAVVVTNTDIHEVPNTWRIAGGAALLLIGLALAFLGARRRRA